MLVPPTILARDSRLRTDRELRSAWAAMRGYVPKINWKGEVLEGHLFVNTAILLEIPLIHVECIMPYSHKIKERFKEIASRGSTADQLTYS